MEKKSYLVVVAHPDDEILGAGATIRKLSHLGHHVSVCVLTQECKTRNDDLRATLEKTNEIIGVEKTFVANFECAALQQESHYAIVEFIEAAIREVKPDVIITHHPGDCMIDHFVTAECCLEAARLPQRLTGYEHKVQDILMMEVPSETDFGFPVVREKFVPNVYNNVSYEDLKAKVEALSLYDYVIRPAPHPRSERNMLSLSRVRGSECGYLYAEAFQSVFRLGV